MNDAVLLRWSMDRRICRAVVHGQHDREHQGGNGLELSLDCFGFQAGSLSGATEQMWRQPTVDDGKVGEKRFPADRTPMMGGQEK